MLVKRYTFLHFVKWSEQRSKHIIKDQLVEKWMIRKKQNQVKGILHYIAPLLLLYSKCELTQSIPHTHSLPLSAGNIGDIALCTRYIVILPTMHTQFLKHLLCKCKVTQKTSLLMRGHQKAWCNAHHCISWCGISVKISRAPLCNLQPMHSVTKNAMCIWSPYTTHPSWIKTKVCHLPLLHLPRWWRAIYSFQVPGLNMRLPSSFHAQSSVSSPT